MKEERKIRDCDYH